MSAAMVVGRTMTSQANSPGSVESDPQTDAPSRRVSRADQQRVARLLEGDEAAFIGLVEQYHGQLVRLALRFVSSSAIAEEVVQETWVAVLKGLKGFQGRSSLKTWLFRILSNRAKTRGVREGRSIPFSALGDGEDGPAVEPERFKDNGRWAQPPRPWSESLPESMALRKELREFVEQTISTLPPNQQVVITLRDVQGCSSIEVCNILEITETNQRVLLHRARSKLRQALESYLEEK